MSRRPSMDFVNPNAPFQGAYTLDTVRLERELVAYYLEIDRHTAREMVETRADWDLTMQSIAMRLQRAVYSCEAPPQAVSYPATWWDAVKARWFPVWALDRWPVVLTEVRWEARAYYPTLTVAGAAHEAVVRVASVRKECA